jgi:flagellar biosynthetic protein FlhB
MQQEMARRRMMQEVPKADVVVTNPTHYAVALRYDSKKMGAPRVVAKGKGLVAEQIRAIAGENKVPLYSAPPLARAIYYSTDLDAEIPAGLYHAVAQVLAYIFQLREGMQVPPPPAELPIPAALQRPV